MDQTERNIEIFRSGMKAHTAELRKDLAYWIERHTGAIPVGVDPRDAKFCGPYVEISNALLETVIDRMLALHGGPDAREFVNLAFDRQVEKYRRSLQ